MNPDLHQLRRDLGVQERASTRHQATPIHVEVEPAAYHAPSGVSLSSFGGWLLTILGIILGIWLLADPICMLLGAIWGLICVVLGFLLQVLIWLFVGWIAFAILRGLFS